LNTWLIALELNCSLYDGGKAKAQAEEHTRHAQGLAEDERRLRLEITTDIKKYLNEIVNYKAILESNLASLAQAKENLRVVQTSYRYGAGSLLDYIDALNLIDTANAAVLETRFNLVQAHTNLERVAGCPLDLANIKEKGI
jgi:outer membrane protein TolC